MFFVPFIIKENVFLEQCFFSYRDIFVENWTTVLNRRRRQKSDAAIVEYQTLRAAKQSRDKILFMIKVTFFLSSDFLQHLTRNGMG